MFPFSIGTSALDIDHGDIGELVTHEPPLTVLPTSRGSHCYYHDDVPRGNKKFAVFGCTGDVRSAKGFLKLHPGGAEKLADALEHAPPGSKPFPADLFAVAGIALPLPHERKPRAGAVVLPFQPSKWPILEKIQKGARHYALFDVVRFWAYAQDKGRSLESWIGRVNAFAQSQNARFPVPQKEAEVERKIAYSIGTWTWAGGGPLDHSPQTQARRGIKSGMVRRRAVVDRDRAIVAAVLAGQTMRAVAMEYGVDHETVRYILARDASLFRPKRGRPRKINGGRT